MRLKWANVWPNFMIGGGDDNDNDLRETGCKDGRWMEMAQEHGTCEAVSELIKGIICL